MEGSWSPQELAAGRIRVLAAQLARGRKSDSSRTVVWCVTSPVTAHAFLVGHLHHLERRGLHTVLICADDGVVGSRVPRFVPWKVDREPSPFSDLRAVADLWRSLQTLAPGTAVVGTPKAGLLGMVAATLARVPRRIYVVHGLRHEGLTGWQRNVMQAAEVLIVTMSTSTVAVSPSVAAGLKALAPWVGRKTRVVNEGSADGVDADRFRPADDEERARIRAELGLAADDTVVLFVGRLTGDKGLSALRVLADELARRRRGERLVIIGEPEPRSQREAEDVRHLLEHPVVSHVPRSEEVNLWMRASDVLAQPTRREGMPTVILEAQFSGLAVASCSVTGVTDAVEHARTGLLSTWGDEQAFAGAVLKLIDDPALRRTLARQSLTDARERFDQGVVRDAWAQLLLEPA